MIIKNVLLQGMTIYRVGFLDRKFVGIYESARSFPRSIKIPTKELSSYLSTSKKKTEKKKEKKKKETNKLKEKHSCI